MTLHQGDCMDIMPTIPTGSVDLILCDLPYGVTANSWDSVIPLGPLWEQYRRILTPTGTAVFTATQPFTTGLVSSAMDLFKYACVWEKNRPTLPQHAKNRPMSRHEDILVFSKGKMGHVQQLGNSRMTYNPQGCRESGEKVVKAKGMNRTLTGPRPNQVGRTYISMTGFPDTILRYDKEEKHLHPTQKPVVLMEYLIRTYSNPGDTVLDNCMGSGTTILAAINTDRTAIGIELDPAYFAIAKSRIQDAPSVDFQSLRAA